jgi:hypothetical protein
MAYVIVVGAALVVGAVVYVSIARRSTQPDTGSFDPPRPGEAVAASVRASDVTYVPVGRPGPISWQTRSISLLGLVAMIMVCASAIGVALYKVGAILVRMIIHKIQTS